jgi:hypothetical protein
VLASWIIVAIDTDSFANEEVSPTAQSYLMNLSMTQQDIYVLIEECRKTEQPNKCVKFAWAVWAQEWGYDTRHPFGMLRQPSRYKGVKAKTTAEYAELRVGSFVRYRHRNNTPQDYLTRSRYCTSWCEHRVPNVTRFIAWYESGNIPTDIWPTGTVPKENLYQKAKDQEARTQKLKEQYLQEQAKAIEYRGDYIKSK